MAICHRPATHFQTGLRAWTPTVRPARQRLPGMGGAANLLPVPLAWEQHLLPAASRGPGDAACSAVHGIAGVDCERQAYTNVRNGQKKKQRSSASLSGRAAALPQAPASGRLLQRERVRRDVHHGNGRPTGRGGGARDLWSGRPSTRLAIQPQTLVHPASSVRSDPLLCP